MPPREEDEDQVDASKMVKNRLNFFKIKEDLRSTANEDPRLASLVVQAFRRRLTLPGVPPAQRAAFLNEISAGDIVGVRELVSTTRMAMASGDAVLRQTWVRFLNAIASFAAGRKYLADDAD